MKALSLWQPWASLVAIQAKKIETRSWRTDHHGLLAIHATQVFPDEAKAVCTIEPFRSVLLANQDKIMRTLGDGSAVTGFPHGAIVAVCELDAVCLIRHDDDGMPWLLIDRAIEHVADAERTFGDYTEGRFAWLLTNIRQLKQPVKCGGH